jgi:undecaprenyl phosphate-alpha-L-ara4FN deformylase
MTIGLRVDVDTYRGTQIGVPGLLQLFERHGILASFFFSVGPDNMGRHLWRLARPAFLMKMLRTRAPSLYGWDILFKGTVWPGPIIGERLADIIRATRDAGHEVGLHAWDHHRWQVHLEKMKTVEIAESLRRGVDLLAKILGSAPTCSAAPGWKCNDRVLIEKEAFHFLYNSDCRGTSIFQPVADGRTLATPQVPVSLPTYDEVVGREGVDKAGYNKYILSLVQPERLNTLTIHAEVEGISRLALFEDFLTLARRRGDEFVPLGALLDSEKPWPQAELIGKEIPGREGWVSCQATA